MTIKNFLFKTRLFLLRQNIILIALALLVFLSILAILGLELEIIFYYSPKIKIFCILIISIIILMSIIIMVINFYRAINNQILKYKLEHIAQNLGWKIFPSKPDAILNALQLEKSVYQSESQPLANSFINTLQNELKTKSIAISLIDSRIVSIKKALLTIWIFLLIIFIFQYEESANAVYRLTHPNTKFEAPKPFTLNNITNDIHILGGETAIVKITANNQQPDTVLLYLSPNQVATHERDSLSLLFKSTIDSNGYYVFKLPELYQDYSYQAIVNANYFWQSWKQVRSKLSTIYVTDRPSFEDLTIKLIPPEYSRLPIDIQKGNIGVVKGLPGSIIQIELESNRLLQSAFLMINEEKLDMKTNLKKASADFKIVENGEFTINLVDLRGITNRDPIPYNIEIIPDLSPRIFVIEPPPITELGNDQIVPIHLEIEDDYGFTDLQLAYEVKRPDYLLTDSYVAMKTIQELKTDTLIQEIYSNWDLSSLFLMPEDEVHFHFELSDNNLISGPNKTISSTFIIKVPSLEDLYKTAENTEENFIEDLEQRVDEIQNLKDQLNTLELDALKATKMDWNQENSLKSVLNKITEELDAFEKVTETLNSLNNHAEKHDLFSKDLLEKFQELSELVNDIIPESLQRNMNNLESALENLDLNQLQEALNNLTENMTQIEEELDRYLDVFKRLQAEQKLDELQNRMEMLFDQQIELDSKINQSNESTELSDLERLKQQEERNIDEFNNLKSLMEQASEIIKPYNEKASESLSDLNESQTSINTEMSLQETQKNLSKQEINDAQKSSQQSLEYFKDLMSQLADIRQQFKNESVSEMVEKIQVIMTNALYLSSKEEKLKQKVNSASRNSPRLRRFATEQQLIQDQLKSLIEQMMSLSKETFAITPEIGRSIGKANAGMEDAKQNLSDRNINQAEKNQSIAMEGLNESALGLFNSIQQMKQSGSASGYEQFLKMMQQMAGQQQGLNQQGMQLGLGQMASSGRKQMMQQMLDRQKQIQQSLNQLIDEMRNSGQQHGVGDLAGINKEMDKVIADLQRQQYNKRTNERQQKILSRMLDSQTSMTQRGFKDERKSTVATNNVIFEGPGGLPSDLGQRQNIALKALNNAINAGYSRENQTMIKRYFNSLSQISEEKTKPKNENLK